MFASFKSPGFAQRSVALGGLVLLVAVIAFAVLRGRREQPLALAAAATAPTVAPVVRSTPDGLPALDAAAPQETRTATFSLG